MTQSTLYIVLLIATVMILIIIVVIIYVLSRSQKKLPVENADTETEAVPAAPMAVVATTELAGSFRGALDILRARTPDSDYRYTLPWYLLIGASGAGKSSLLAESSLSSDITEQIRVEQGAGLSWNFLGDGVVLDVSGDWSFGNSSNAPGTWRRLLHLLRRHRPERPIDGVVVALSARDLVGSTALESSALTERASFLQQRLRQIQSETGLRLPVYFVLTHCEVIEGFAALAQSLKPEEREEIFGWANPYSTELQFRAEWTDIALAELRRGIDDRLNQVFATEEYSRSHDTLMLLPVNLMGLQPRLKLFLSRALRASNNVPEPFFRGIYCTGLVADSATANHNAMPAMRGRSSRADFGETSFTQPGGRTDWAALSSFGVPEMMERWSPAQSRVVYARDVFVRRIFRERALAAPLPNTFLRRDRTRSILQGTAAALAVLLGLGLVFGYRGMSTTRDHLLPLLTNVANDMAVRTPYGALDTTLQTPTDDLIRATLLTDEGSVHSVFYPESWGRPLDTDVQHAIAPAFRVLVLERFERQLERRASQVTSADILTPGAAEMVVRPASANTTSTAIADLPSYQVQRNYVDALLDLQQHISMYSELSTPNSGAGLQQVVKLDSYLNNRPEVTLPDNATSPAFEEALAKEPWRTFRYSQADERSTTQHFTDMSTLLFSDAIENNGIKTAADATIASLRRIAGVATPAYEDLRAAQRAFQALNTALRRPDLAWVGGEELRMPTDLANVTIAPIGKTAYLPETLRPSIAQAASDAFHRMSASLSTAAAPQSGALLTIANGRVLLSDRAQEVQLGIENLLNLSFVAPHATGTTLRGGAAIDWNKPALQEALKLPESMRRYLSEDLEQAPAPLRASLGRIARDRLGSAMESAVADAETPGTRLSSNARLDTDIQPAIQRFAAAAPTLRDVLESMRANGVTAPYNRLRAVTDEQALSLLDSLDRAFNAEALYAVPASVLDRWSGNNDPTPVLFNAASADDLAGYLAAQRERARAFSAAADPLVQFLSANGDSGNRLVRRWLGITTALRQYDAKRPGNSVAQLETFLGTDVPKLRIASACVEAHPPARAGGDYFQQVALELGGELRVRCESLRGSGAISAYDALAMRFNTDLADRFPFADRNASAITEASPRSIAQVYELLDGYAPLLKASAGTPAQRAFLQTLTDARPFFTALNSKPAAASIDVIPHFRYAQEREVGGNQIADWTLEIGSQTFRSGEPEKKGTWLVGQPVLLKLRWARNAAFVPVDAISPNMRSDSSGVQYQFSDAWALLRMMTALAAPPTDAAAVADGSSVLMMTIPERGVRTLAAMQPAPTTMARVYLRLDLLAPGKPDLVAAPPLPLPSIAPPAMAGLPRGRLSGSLKGSR